MKLRTIAAATAVAGTLDIASAMVLTVIAGKPIARMLRSVASGPLGDWPLERGLPGAAAGLAVHFALMTVMAALFVNAAQRIPALIRHPIPAGIAYGIAIYLVMYWLVMPLRWPGSTPELTMRDVVIPVAIHVMLVGIPIALITATMAGRRDGAVVMVG